ncbi:MAG: energy transducer TonB [Bacteroidia bacterium]|nr:energy transducer TonB [Bacteroidia bacterium]MBP7243979.1 energy transducer TonB [Bacteroidia bacterium]
MKKLLLILICAVPLAGISQQLTEKDPKNEDVFIAVEKMPEYPGGNGAMMKYISNNLKYPDDAAEKDIQGKVYVSFIVSELGKISDVEVVRGVNELLDNEAKRIVKDMPTWKPGMQGDKPVKVKFILPIVFKLN